MGVVDRYKDLVNTLPEEDKTLFCSLSLNKDEIDRMVSSNDFTTIEDGIKKFLDNLYDGGVLTTKPSVVVAGYDDTVNSKQFIVNTCFGK